MKQNTERSAAPDRSIQTATSSEMERCLAVLTLAFSADPPCRWVWPDPQQYLEAFPRFARAFGGGAIDQGTAYSYEGFSGAALWLSPGVAPDEASLARVIEDTLTAERKGAMFSIFEQMAAFHPREAHWHLALIGVDPAYQGNGIGSALLSHVLHICDDQNVIAYLEATNQRNARLYKRHGFEAIGSIQVGDSPQIIPMLRKPGGSYACDGRS
jgi:GNAT superfamily N-acetyltransferase